MKQLSISTTTGDSQIEIGKDGLTQVNQWLKNNYYNSKVAIITDSNVRELYREQVEAEFPDALILTVDAGEESKRMEVTEQLCLGLLKDDFTRTDVVVGLGGGMVTDLAGFVASVYMRGITYIAIPTSLLAMVDAAIGGKTGVNLEAKNIIGTFHPAELVMIDPKFLSTLPEREMTSGIAEVIKYAATLDASLEDDLKEGELNYMTIIQKCVAAKVKIVNEDLKEIGLRKVFNFGHTFGHAIEAKMNYKLSHGEAIGIGMVLANKIAQQLGKQTPKTDQKIKELLKKFDLPTELPEGMALEDLQSYIAKDKKKSGEEISFIIAPEMGSYEIVKLTLEELMQLVK